MQAAIDQDVERELDLGRRSEFESAHSVPLSALRTFANRRPDAKSALADSHALFFRIEFKLLGDTPFVSVLQPFFATNDPLHIYYFGRNFTQPRLEAFIGVITQPDAIGLAPD